MLFVSGTYCTDVERTCLKKEDNGANHITLCHSFAHETKCVGTEEKRAFCIDEYEYPNQKDAHPSWMVTWYEAQATCQSKGKRLCYETEWTMACEGPDKTPFPYGWDRDNTACNIDNEWLPPSLEKMNAAPDAGQLEELARLDQSVPSGKLERCVSGFGVRDMTGNFDEWTTNDRPRAPKGQENGMWASLKGGAWGHVRNACRPLTTSHSPGWSYYFVSFRCCADAKGHPVYSPPPEAWPARTVKAEDKAPPVTVSSAPGPSKVKVPPGKIY
jgi:formylglycine-generating enzyme required for sulfatase activity